MENTDEKNQMGTPFYEENEISPKRSNVLTVFLILSFIGGALSFLNNLIMGATYDSIKLFIEDGKIPEALSFMEDSFNLMFSAGKGYYFLSALFCLTSFIGAIFMWQMKKLGFFFYSGAQLVLLILPFAVLGVLGLGEILLTALFIGYYALNVKDFR